MKKPKRQCQIGKPLKHIIKQVRSFTSFQMVHTHTQLCHTHTQLCHRQSFAQLLRHTQLLCHTQLCHIQLGTLCHTHTIFLTQLCHTQLFHTHTTLSEAIFHTQLCHTHSLSRTSLSHTLSHTICHTHSFVTHTIFYTQICQSCVRMQLLKLSILHHLHCPFCFLRAASTTFSDYWKKLTCGVLRSFNCLCMLMLDLVFGYTCFIIL